jgi:soluble lytic murein transglycosylase-like protein
VSIGAAKLAGVLAILVTALLLSGVAGAKDAKAPSPQSSGHPAQNSGLQSQRSVPEGEVGGLTKLGSSLKEAQAEMDTADSRLGELDQQTQKLRRDLVAQRGAASDSQARFEERAKAAYKGEHLAGATLVLDSIFSGDSARINTVLDGTTGWILVRSLGSIQFNKDSKQALEQTIRQLDQKKVEYRKARDEQRARAEELRQRAAELKDSKQAQMEARISELEAAAEAGAFTRPPASDIDGGSPEMQERELEIASQDIVAQPVEPIPYERYLQIYKASAKRYGFEDDWYVLAAVGQVESNHGEHMGPSSAGAMGPMQFLPSTWEKYGLDGNKDGDENIMDPEDAIPAAASYLQASGAPEDWPKALYTYNRAGWYVRDVMGIAEGYRQQDGREDVEPYL